jgi:hypothetical protein
MNLWFSGREKTCKKKNQIGVPWKTFDMFFPAPRTFVLQEKAEKKIIKGGAAPAPRRLGLP